MKKYSLALLLTLLFAPLASAGPIGGGGGSGGGGSGMTGFTTGNLPVGTSNSTVGDSGIAATKGTANNLSITGGTTGNPVVAGPTGSDTNIPFRLQPKGNEGDVQIPIDTNAGSCASAVVIGDLAAASSLRTLRANYTCGPLMMASDYVSSLTLLSNNSGTFNTSTWTGAFGSGIYLLRGNGSITAPTKTLANQHLGEISFGGFTDDSGTVVFDHAAPSIIAVSDSNFDEATTGTIFLRTGTGGTQYSFKSTGLSIDTLTASRLVATDASKNFVSAAAGITVTCSVMPTTMTITGGIITAVTGGTCE